MDTELLKAGISLMFIGMGTVFVFLMVMIFAMNITYRVIEIINKYYPEETLEVNKSNKQHTDDTEIAIAIASAFKAQGG